MNHESTCALNKDGATGSCTCRAGGKYDHAMEAALAGLRDGLGLGPSDAAIALARRFHEAYERLAPQYGYVTRADTREFDHRTTNGRLMVAVCEELLRDGPSHKTGAWLR